MLTILKIAGLIFEQFASLLLNEFFWIIVLIMILVYKKNTNMEAMMLNSSYSLLHKASSSVTVGLAGGLLGSLMAILVGISIADYTGAGESSLAEGITYIWIVAILLAFINPRYLCFSYSGGIICLMNLMLGFPRINVPGLLALIGVLHLIESFLIWLDGYTYSLPMFLRRHDGKIIGGYYMNKIWPIPLVVFAIMLSSEGAGASPDSIINMPDWWPLLKHSAAQGDTLMYLPLVVPVILGYGDIAITKAPEKKCRSSAARLAGYSLILVLLSVIASKLRPLAYAAAVFAPLAHEMLILYGTKEEETGKPYFANKETGLKVLHVKKGKAADNMKIEPGDTILGINGIAIYSEEQLTDFLDNRPSYIWLDIEKAEDGIITVEHSNYPDGVGDLGVITVPRNGDFYYEINRGRSPIKKIVSLFKKDAK
ncbi:MAG TPA: PDZ domain-containing protein [Bacillota bacterium]|nr:PDZ domain-containing protein [Bacillota bacterium]